MKHYTKFVITTVLPDKRRIQRKNYVAPRGAFLTVHHFPAILAEHRLLLAGATDAKFREVSTGPNSCNFIHPDCEKGTYSFGKDQPFSHPSVDLA